MRSLSTLVFMTLALNFSAQADVKLLDCNIPNGDLQQVTVIQNSQGQLLLKELNSSGNPLSRKLSAKEWNSKKIVLSVRYGSGLLSIKNGGWWYELNSPGTQVLGFAHCF
jgi:hypothetical protein